MITTTEQEKAAAHEFKSVNRLSGREIAETLEKHSEWLNSGGEAGVRADFGRKNLAGADLIDARLQDTLFHKTTLKGADLTLSDLRGADLLQANLAEANLLGAQFEQANLQAADLRGATGLLMPRLAGANLFGASLPETISPLTGLKLVRDAARRAGWMLGVTLFLNGLVCLRILTTQDADLVKNSSAFPFSPFRGALPYVPFYLFGPVLIFVLYVYVHLYLQKVWDGIAQLPAVFPDGRTLDACIPWFARWPARKSFKWLRNRQFPLAFLEAGIAMLVLYWTAPATLLLFWGRYMTLEDLRGTILHILMVMAAITSAMGFPRMATKAFGTYSFERASEQNPRKLTKASIRRMVPLGIGLALFLLSLGTYFGVPHDPRAAGQATSSGIQAWAPSILWTIGYNPFAQLTEADVSTKPLAWTGRDDEIPLVKGANLNRLRLRYVQAYRAFLAKARFWRTDLRNAYLSEADLRDSNFRQADLQYAVLDHARMARATLREVDLRNANLDRADLRDANLSFAYLSYATLLDASLDGANLYKTNLREALLQRASLSKADLREANLQDSNLSAANLGEAYLISTNLRGARVKSADFSQAILTDADLQKSDLSGAVLRGAVLGGTNLAGAILQGADLRGAVGLTPAQVCSAASLKEAQMDETLQQQVSILCSNLR